MTSAPCTKRHVKGPAASLSGTSMTSPQDTARIAHHTRSYRSSSGAFSDRNHGPAESWLSLVSMAKPEGSQGTTPLGRAAGPPLTWLSPVPGCCHHTYDCFHPARSNLEPTIMPPVKLPTGQARNTCNPPRHPVFSNLQQRIR